MATLFTPTLLGDELSSVNLNAQLTQLQTAILARYGAMRVLVPTVTLVANTTTIDIQNIPQTCKNLKILALLRTNLAGTGGDNPLMFFNNSHTAANYASKRSTVGSGGGNIVPTDISVAGAGEMVMGLVQSAGMPANQFSPVIIDIQDYTSTTLWKVMRALSGTNTDAAGANNLSAGFWNQALAISRIGLQSNGGAQFIIGCSYTIYGLD